MNGVNETQMLLCIIKWDCIMESSWEPESMPCGLLSQKMRLGYSRNHGMDWLSSVPDKGTLSSPIVRIWWTPFWSPNSVNWGFYLLIFHTLYLLFYWLVIQGYNSGIARWRRCIGQGMGEGAKDFHAHSQTCYFSCISKCSLTQRLS